MLFEVIFEESVVNNFGYKDLVFHGVSLSLNDPSCFHEIPGLSQAKETLVALATRCINANPAARPPIGDVVAELSRVQSELSEEEVRLVAIIFPLFFIHSDVNRNKKAWCFTPPGCTATN
jgi:hypothetical protein